MNTVARRIGRLTATCAASALAIAVALSTAWAEDDTKTFDIRSKPLAEALMDFGLQSDTVVVAPSDLTTGKTAKPVRGELTPTQALERILEGTGLGYARDAEGNVTIVISSLLREGAGAQAPGQVALVQEAQRTVETGGRAGASDAARTGRVTGTVTDRRTGANLKGALVEIVETGQTIATDDLGRFRFPSVRAGSYTLRISYLGFADSLAQITVVGDRELQRDFALRGGTEMEELVVYGTRSARALALNRERTSENVSTVLSADLLGNFTGTTISEALRRAPGVAFTQNSLTGDGTNVIIRGLEPDFNTVTLNGIELPVGNGRGRSAGLNNILADSIERITINKTLLPSQDSGGTGGLIEIETKSPFDRARRYANVLVEGGWRAKDFGDDLLVSGTISGTFGSDDTIGLSASVQYRDRDSATIFYNNGAVFGQHLPLEADGSTSIRSTNDIDPRTPFPFEPSADDVYTPNLSVTFGDVRTENLAITLSSEWQPADHTNLQLDYQRSVADVERFARSSNFISLGGYEELPVQSLDGEVRRALVWNGEIFSGQSYTFTPTRKDETDVLTFRGASRFGNWEVDYNAGYTRGEFSTREIPLSLSSSPSALDPSFLLPEATDSVEGRIITLFGRRQGKGVQLPLLTQAGFDLINDPQNYSFSRVQTQGSSGRNERYTGGVSIRRHFDNPYLQYLEAGFDYERSQFQSSSDDVEIVSGSADLASLGLAFDQSDLSAIGIDGGLRVIARADLERFLDEIFTLAEDDDRFSVRRVEQDPLLRMAFTNEEEFAGYVQTRVDVADWEVIGGVRVTAVKVKAVNRSGPFFLDENGVPDLEFSEAFARLITQTATQTDILPRLLVNYRPDTNLVFRGGYFLSVARPQIRQLSNDQRVSLVLLPRFGPNDNQPQLQVSEGNPDLNPSKTHNFDLSAEYYSDQIGVIKLGVFYKRIDDFIQTNATVTTDDLEGVQLPDDPRFQTLPDNIFVQVLRPENATGVAEIWGLEAAIERQFTFLPDFWSGFGVFVNYTYSDSSRTQSRSWNAPVFDDEGNFVTRERAIAEFPSEPFEQQPKHSGTAALTYNKYGIDATLAYTAQAKRKQFIFAHDLVRFDDSADTLDFRIEYRFDLGPGNFRLYFEGADLLKGTDDPAVLSSRGGVGAAPTAVESGTYFGGREFRLGFSATL